MTQLWVPGDPITVLTDPQESSAPNTLEPVQFTWNGQNHAISQITRRWRVDLDWWRQRVWRAYYKLSTETGLLVIIYQDLVSDQWFLQRLYD